MNWHYSISKLSRLSSRHWFSLGLVGIFLISLYLRFWKLSQFNTLVFDEVYYAIFANNYLTGTNFFQSHPPLSQYLIAFGIWLGSFLPASPDTINDLTGSLRSTFSYRWLNALTGSFIPLIFAAIAYQLTRRRYLALLAAFFVALDGLFLVESRYALNNIYLILFGLLGQLFFLMGLNNRAYRWYYFPIAGVWFGCSASIKWNGLGFLLAIYLLITLAYINKIINLPDSNFLQSFLTTLFQNLSVKEKQHKSFTEKVIDIFQECQSLNIFGLLLTLAIVPALFYSILWIPHLILNPEYNFIEVHKQIFSFHQKVGGNTPDVHPYCSPWYSWLIMWRPVAYFYERKEVLNNKTLIYDVHGMANPFLLWLSSLAIIIVLILFFSKLWSKKALVNNPSHSNIIIYSSLNYIANLIPWLKIDRCTFLYHYMPSYSFAILALAWITNICIHSKSSIDKISGITIIVVITLSFIHWAPIFLGIPLSELGFKLRMLFANWV